MDKIDYYSLFSLFHHNVTSKNIFSIFDSDSLLSLSKDSSRYEIIDIADALFSIVKKNSERYRDSEISLTLTGGMDSRLILAALLKAGIKPNCLTYGNPNNVDVLYARNIAKKFNLPYHNACKDLPNKEWYYKWVIETIKRDKGNSHLHRAHRTAAIAEHKELYNPKLLFTGHMGGESIRGLTYNNYFTSPFFELVNEGVMSVRDAAIKVLNDYFIKVEALDVKHLIDKIMELNWMRHNKKINRFYFLNNLVANIHHYQDIRIYQSYIPKVLPVYMENDYLGTLYSSRYHFMAKKNGILGRLQSPYVYCKIIEYLYPELLEFPLANGYKPSEYLKGLWYYVPVKIYRERIQKNNFTPSFSYGAWYEDFVKEHAQNIHDEIWEIFDKNRYFEALYNKAHKTDEGYWHKFSNPVYFDLVRKYNLAEL